ncbi:MAG: hypothetical protein HFE77_01760 [Clostridiales bacterium]|nr:hypothetical protein [Clostridiales bacterium]
MKNLRLNLTLFGEEGTGTPGTESTGNEASSPLAEVQKNQDAAPRVVYGKQKVNPEAKPEEKEPASEEETASDRKAETESFEDLIAGKYKEDFEKRVEDIWKKRFKNKTGFAELEEQNASMRELLENTARRYGLDPASETLLDDIRKAQDADDEIYAKEAYDKGVSVEEYRRDLKREQEIKTLSQKVEENEKREAQRVWLQNLQNQVPQVQKIFPTFNLDEEMKNPDFAYLVRPGSPTSIEDAMYAVHHREILSGAVKTAAQEAAKKTANTIAAGRARPIEGGLSTPPPVIVKNDPSKWTKEDLAEIRRRVARGERIEL